MICFFFIIRHTEVLLTFPIGRQNILVNQKMRHLENQPSVVYVQWNGRLRVSISSVNRPSCNYIHLIPISYQPNKIWQIVEKCTPRCSINNFNPK